MLHVVAGEDKSLRPRKDIITSITHINTHSLISREKE